MNHGFYKVISPFLIVLFVLTINCGATSSSDSSSSDFSDLTYPEAVDLYVTEGLDFTETAGSLANSHNTFLTLDTTSSDVSTLESALTGFTDDLSAYVTAVEDINSLEEIAFDDSASASFNADLFKYQSIDPSGVDSLNSLTDAMLAKKKECDDLFALVPSLPSSPEDFTKLEAAQACVREAQALALANGFDAAVVSGGGGLVGGVAGGAAVVYLGGTVLSGGGLLVVTVAGIIGSRIASYIFSGCTSGGSSNLKKVLYADSSDSCAISSGSGSTDGAMTLMAVGTGTLQVFIEDCAPIILDGIVLQNGQTTTVNATCEDILEDTEASDVTANSDSTVSSAEASEAVTCAEIYGLSSVNSPSDPGIYDAVTVTSTTIPPAAGCSVTYSMSGTDDYAQSATLTTDAAGAISFTIPAAEVEGIVDTVTTTEAASGKTSTITYVF